MHLIRSKSDCREYIPQPSMQVVRTRIACLNWTITRYCDNLTIATPDAKYAIDENSLVNMIWQHRKTINDDLRIAFS